ncbi:MAG: phage portal protein, partial [Firmicutes bacterium]|nr:phage portal protein [Bacillota bacterium]
YILGRKPVIKAVGCDKEKSDSLEMMVEKVCMEDFNMVLQDLMTGASNKGFECVHVYYDEKGKLCYTIVPAEEIIPIYDSRYENELEQVIRYYDTVVMRNGQKYLRKRIEWWTKDDVTYFVEDDNRNYVMDMGMEHNPCPHWWGVSTEDGYETEREAHGWGRVPFVILKNNGKGTTDLEGIKGLIDAYDMLSSEGVNNLTDLVELYWVIQGYGGETAAAIAKKLQINKAVHINDNGGAVEAKQTELSMEGRLEFMKMLRRDIFQFGQGVDLDVDRLSNAPSGVSLRYQYTLLDLKADSVITRLKKAIKELLWYIVEDYNMKHETEFDSEDLRVSIKKNMITNDYETVQMINMSNELLSRETLLSMHPFVEEVGSEKYESGI